MARKVLLSVLFGLLVILGLALLGDIRQTARALGHFQWAYAPLILGLTLFNYALRFVKWHYYLHILNVRTISLADSARVFLANFIMVMTPGKVGEFFKAYLLKQVAGTPVAHSAPIVVAERVTDGMAMGLLALLGLTTYRAAWPALALILGTMLAGVALVQMRPLALRALGWGERLPLLSPAAHSLHALYESAYRILRWDALALAVGLGVLSWGAEGLAFYLVLRGLGLPSGALLLLQAVFILAFATIVGAVSALPGGLGAAEGSLTGLLLLLVTREESLAVAATLLIRLFTLWFGVLLGAAVLLACRHRLLGARPLTLSGVGEVP